MSYSRRHANPIGRESVFLSELVRSLSRNEGQVPAEVIAGFRDALSGSSDDPRPEIDRVYMMASYIAANIVPIAIGLEGERRELLKIPARSELAIDNVASLEAYTRSARGVKDYFLGKQGSSGATADAKVSAEIEAHNKYPDYPTDSPSVKAFKASKRREIIEVYISAHKETNVADSRAVAEAEAHKKYPDYPTDSPGVRAFKADKRREVIEIAISAHKARANKVIKKLSISVLDLAIAYCEASEELSREFESMGTLSKERTALAANLAAQLIVLILSATQLSAPVGTAPLEQRYEEASGALANLMSKGLTREAALKELRASASQYARGEMAGSRGELLAALDRLARDMKIHHSRYTQGGPVRQPTRVIEDDESGGPEIVRRFRKRTPNPYL